MNGEKLHIKGATCRILTLLKHINTIICLQIFKKHAKLTYLCICKKMLQSVILLWKCVSVFVMVCEPRPLPVYPIVFRHAGLPVGVKHSVFHAIHHHVRPFQLVSLIWQPECVSNLRRRGRVKKLDFFPILVNSTQFFNPSQFYIVISILVNSTLFPQSWSILHSYSNPSQFYTIFQS